MKATKPIYLRLIFLLVGMQISIQGINAQSVSLLDEMSLSNFASEVLEEKEKPWVVDFWASWCKPCIYSIPELAKLEKKWGSKGVTFVSVSWDQNKNAGVQAAKRLRMDWKQVFPPDIRNTPFLDKHFKHKFLPTIFLVYPNGKVKKVALESLDKKLNKVFKKMN